MMVLARHGMPVIGYDDTMLMSYALDAGTRGGHGMDELAQNHLGHKPVAFKDVCGAGKKQISFRAGRSAAGHPLRRRGCGRDDAATRPILSPASRPSM